MYPPKFGKPSSVNIHTLTTNLNFFSGAWFVSTAGTPTVRVVAKLLGRKPLTLIDEQEADKDRGEFAIDAKTVGTYSFCFENAEPQEQDSKILTFSIDVVTNTNTRGDDQVAKPEHVKQIVESTKDLKATIASLQTELEVILLRFSAQAESQDFVEQRVSWFTLMESFFILIMACGQIYYVRRLVNGKGAVNRLWV